MGLRTPKSKPKKTKTLIVDGNVLMKRSYLYFFHLYIYL